MSTLKKKLMAADILLLIIAVFFFLYLAPSVEVRARLIYIIPQAAVCAVIVFGCRFLVGVYKEYFHDVDSIMYSRVYMHLVISDFIACVLFYLFQLILPEGPIRITLLRVVCIIVFNLVESMVLRMFYQSGAQTKKEDLEIIDALKKSKRSKEEILEYLKN